jgi:TrmH family RNA methyltransferase
MNQLIGRRGSVAKHIRAFGVDSDARERESVLLVEGEIVLAEAIEAGAEVVEVVVRDGHASSLVDSLLATGVLVHYASADVVDWISTTATPQPVVAVVRLGRRRLPDAAPTGLLVLGIELQDPGNIGTTIRSAAAFGASGFVLSAASADPYAPKAVRASAGALFRLPVFANCDIDRMFSTLSSRGPIVAAVARGGVQPEDIDFSGAVSLAIGNEARGLSEAFISRCSQRVTIPMAARTESLNAGVAAAVLCAEAARQRRQRSTS